MKMYRFETEADYDLWCRRMINKIYYANIVMNDDKIREVVSEIATRLHLSEGMTVIRQK